LWVFVAGFHFQGTSALALDARGRLSVSARPREVLRAIPEDRPTLTLLPGSALDVDLARASRVQRHSAVEAALLQRPMPALLQDFSF
jgi:DNA-binding transcriptional regulator/RsmH inhibitor MraZ